MSNYESGYDPKYGYNRNAFAHGTIGTAIAGKTVKLIATPIGLISEAIQARKDKKRSQSVADHQVALGAVTKSSGTQESVPSDQGLDDTLGAAYVNVPANQADELISSGQAVAAEGQKPTHELVPENDKDDGIEGDEVDWALDEAAGYEDTGPPVPSEKDNEETVESLVNNIRPAKGILLLSKKTPFNLPFPVILPQRRPGTKTRGFVRAYAPVLQESGIDQEMFLSFLKSFHRAMQASPIFEVVKIATAMAAAYPDPIVGVAFRQCR